MLVDAVTSETDGAISSDGPRTGRRESWCASLRLKVPRTSSLSLEAHNGGVSIEDVTGELAFDTTNGGVRLSGVGGDVRGETTNGGVRIDRY